MSDVENALELTEAYVRDIALPNLEKWLPEYTPHIAVGLVGNGSECFGYDDSVSRDHDWGVDFFVWASSDDVDMLARLAAWKSRLFKDYSPRHIREKSKYGARASVMTIGDFYRSLIGVEGYPRNIQQWMRIPEENLAMAVNGRVFFDGNGEFSRIREKLMLHYPDDLRLRRIATGCMLAAQSGQYNFLRMAKRGDIVTSRLCLQRFIDQVEKIAFLLNRTYRPYYKWAFRAMKDLPVLGEDLADELRGLSAANLDDLADVTVVEAQIERTCGLIERELRAQGLSDCTDSFIQPYGEDVFSRIEDPMLRGIPITMEI